VCDFIAWAARSLGNSTERWQSSRLQRLHGLLAFSNFDDLVHRVSSPSHFGSVVKEASGSYSEPFSTELTPLQGVDVPTKIMLCDLLCYLPDDILVKVDRASMGVSLEVRTPLLSHKLVEFALSLPIQFKLRDGRGKWLLRNLLYKHVPKQLLDRPKHGFSIPLAQWLRGGLREWASDLLTKSSLEKHGHFHTSVIQKRWKEHLTGKVNWDSFIWSIVMFQSWISTLDGSIPTIA